MIQIHKNYTKAAKLMLVAFAVEGVVLVKGFISIFTIDSDLAQISPTIDAEGFKSAMMIKIILTSLYYLAMAHFIRQGYNWVKFLLLVFILLGINNLVGKVAEDITSNILETIIDVIVTVIEIWIVMLLFQAPKNTLNLEDQHTII